MVVNIFEAERSLTGSTTSKYTVYTYLPLTGCLQCGMAERAGVRCAPLELRQVPGVSVSTRNGVCFSTLASGHRT